MEITYNKEKCLLKTPIIITLKTNTVPQLMLFITGLSKYKYKNGAFQNRENKYNNWTLYREASRRHSDHYNSAPIVMNKTFLESRRNRTHVNGYILSTYQCQETERYDTLCEYTPALIIGVFSKHFSLL